MALMPKFSTPKEPMVLLAGGNPQIAKADGDAPVQAYLAAMPGWKKGLGLELDELIGLLVQRVIKAGGWNSPSYSVEGQGWFVSLHDFTKCVKVTFFSDVSLHPVPPGGTAKAARRIDIHEGDLDIETMDPAGRRHPRLGQGVAMRAFVRFAAIALWFTCGVAGAQGADADAQAGQLATLINAYRNQHGLSAVAVSTSLTRVAMAHAQDLERNARAAQCNSHSWSSEGPWQPCCYTRDHAQAQCMWDKPKEITQGRYAGPGFEIISWASGGNSPAIALARWRASPGHLAVILNRGDWANSRWQSMGVAISVHYAVAWFGEDRDAGAAR